MAACRLRRFPPTALAAQTCRRRLHLRPFLTAVCIAFVTQVLAPRAEADDAADLARTAVRILRSRCQSCHGPQQQEGELRVDSREALLKGGSRGPAVTSPDTALSSLLLRSVTPDDPELQMPPKQPLTQSEVTVLKHWLTAGAPWPETADADATLPPDTGSALADPRNPIHQLFGGERLTLWSLRPPQPTELPNTPGHPIDRLLQAELVKHGLQLSPPADRRTLLRRATLELTGLLPTALEVQQFATDTAPDAWERAVDRLLSSTQYGERQARLWLDVVRYADTNGYERDEFRPEMWRYRDYVVRSFNSDKPFNQFVREQLAGDELAGTEPETAADVDALIATGFLRLGQWDSTATIFQEEPRLQAEIQADLTNTTASAFLGLTMSCCQCHDHKYDPLSQADHYRLRAFFASATPRNDLPAAPAELRKTIDAANARIEMQRTALQQELEGLSEQQSAARSGLQKQLDELQSQLQSHAQALGVVDRSDSIPATRILAQGDFAAPGEETPPGFPAVLDPHPAVIAAPRQGTSGRRLALADWIVSPGNPWTARVFVNRIWQQHFGRGLVATANDFGITGSAPVHQPLLDWLALEWIRSGWSVKSLHRLILTSAAWQQQSGRDDMVVAASHPDPENQLFWRQNLRRLDAETVRDVLLQTSGLLKEKSAGRPVWPPVPQELLEAQPAILEALEGKDDGRRQGWYADPVEETDVRSLYLVRKRCLPIPFLQVFDLPDTTSSCARRDETIVAPQAIMLLNSPETARCCNALAERLLTACKAQTSQQLLQDTPRSAVDAACRILFQRPADEVELARAEEFLRELSATAGPDLALKEFARALLNTNEFLYVD
ncbi:MAG: DUF1553 domain-containing protein [Planctomycetaceae bacterium]